MYYPKAISSSVYFKQDKLAIIKKTYKMSEGHASKVSRSVHDRVYAFLESPFY